MTKSEKPDTTITPIGEVSENPAEDVKSHKYCLRCGRLLKNPDSRLIGYGPVCLEKQKRSKLVHKLF